ncbi:MAG: aldo/keto reductase [Flaviaesturariibacter sp.]|nr:aldo/keto reductase [Flaviaesturariibacter sp.]
MFTRIIPSTGEALPVIGLGTWQAFDTDIKELDAPQSAVLKTMKNAGSTLIDSSPMYGKAEEAIGKLMRGSFGDNFFYATKVWTTGREEGILQMNASFQKMGRTVMDLMQIHNLVDWKTQLKTLREWKEQGKIRYIGITHYTDNMHGELEAIIRKEEIDFVQFNYSITARHAEKTLLPLAADRGVATLINRPLGEGALMRKVIGKPLPIWASEYDIPTWSAFFLKFILSHPAVTCVIPATSDPKHAAENYSAGKGNLPDAATREAMATYISSF